MKYSHLFLIILVLLFSGFVILLLSGFLTPLILAVIIAILTRKWYEKLHIKLRGRKNLAALFMILVIVVIIIVPSIILLTLTLKEVLDLYHKINIYLTAQQIEQFLKSDSPAPHLVQNISQIFNIDIKDLLLKEFLPIFKNIGLYIFNQLDNILSNIFKLALGFFVMLVAIFYLLRDGHLLGNFLTKIIPLETDYQIRLYQTFEKVSRAVFYGNFVSAFSQGLLGGISFLIFGLASPVFWGLTMAFVALIPLLGPYLIFLPVALYLFLTEKTFLALGFLLYNMILTSGIDNIIKPKLISRKVQIHPFLILISIFGGLKIFGVLGIIYGPLIVAVFLTLIDIYIQTKQKT